jgi:hypothetical protein
MCGWFFLLYNVERLVAPINIASFVYILAAVLVFLIILLPKLGRISFHWLFLMALSLFFVLKNLLGYEIAGTNLPVTIIEISVLGFTIILAQLTGQRFEALQEALTSLTIGPLEEEIQSFGTGQGQIYREIRRARRHQRPAALLSIAATKTASPPIQNHVAEDVPLRRFLEEVQREILQKYVSARIANLLVSELGDLAIVTQRNDHFVTLLPETDRDSLQEVIHKLRAAAAEKLGLELQIGMSTFPDEAVTFETMLEQAEAEMANTRVTNKVRIERLPASTTNALHT